MELEPALLLVLELLDLERLALVLALPVLVVFLQESMDLVERLVLDLPLEIPVSFQELTELLALEFLLVAPPVLMALESL